jgi:hypothetical protein
MGIPSAIANTKITASGNFGNFKDGMGSPVLLQHLSTAQRQVLSPPETARVTALRAKQAASSDVNLDLNDQLIDCVEGIVVGGSANHVSIMNVTLNGTAQILSQGLQIYVGCTYVSVKNVNFNGLFAYNADYGSYTSLKNCNFESPLSIISG